MDEPTPDEAAQVLAGLTPVIDRSQRMVSASNLSHPLIAWGVAWMVGGAAVQLLPTVAGAVIGVVACVGAAVVTWAIRNRSIRTGRERRVMAGWVVLLISSALFVVIAAPSDRAGPLVIPAAVWALGLVLYGTATPDRPCVIAGGAIIVVAAAGRILLNEWEVLLVGGVGGLVMVIAGLIRWGDAS